MPRRPEAADGRRRLDEREDRGTPTPGELRALLALADDPHFGRAADRLGLAQSSLSETLRRLEAKLGVVLFERSSRRVRLSTAGARLLPVARRALDALDAVQALIEREDPDPDPGRELAGAQRDGFRVGIEVPGLAEVTGPVLRAFGARHPETPLALREFSCAHGFFAERLDVALVRSPILDERLTVHPVASEPRAFLVGPGHPVADAPSASLRDFEDAPFVGLVDEAPHARDYWLAVDERDGERPRIGAEAFTAGEIVQGVLHLGAVGIGVVSGSRMGSEIAHIPAEDLAPNVVGLAVRARDTRPLVLDFIDVARRLVSDLRGLAPGLTPA